MKIVGKIGCALIIWKVIVVIFFIATNSGAMAENQIISDLTVQDQARLNDQRSVIEKYLADEENREKYGTPAGKLGTLRALLEAEIFSSAQTYELQSMGIVLGDAIVQDMGFHWVMVEDEFGRDPALRYQDTSVILYPLTMISKRVERGEEIDVFDLYNGVAATANNLIKQGY